MITTLEQVRAFFVERKGVGVAEVHSESFILYEGEEAVTCYFITTISGEGYVVKGDNNAIYTTEMFKRLFGITTVRKRETAQRQSKGILASLKFW